MKRNLSLIIGFFFSIMSVAQEYRNPVIPGFHPDPSVCRVGNDFYLVNSSFQYFPGVPVFHSRDLIHWKQIGNVLDRDSQLQLKGATSWTGIYAPTIRYNEGLWYVITTNVGGGGNFLVTAKTPKGPWSDPVWLKQQGIDPSLYFENGHCYMVSNPDNALTLCEIDPNTGRQLTESIPIWHGTGNRYPEGPHIYKKNGWYYLLVSEGGTELAHRLTIARSHNIWGPYEADPHNPVLTNCNVLGQSKQIQGTGHGDLVQAADGSWWIVFLAYRNYGGSYHHLGRETCLAPVKWPESGWPVVYGGQAIDTLMKAETLSQTLVPEGGGGISFKNGKLGPEWIYIQNPVRNNYEFREGALRLHGSVSSLTENDHPTFVGRRQEHAGFSAETTVTPVDVEAGLSVYQINNGHFDLFVKDGKVQLRCVLKNIHYIVNCVGTKAGKTRLRICSDGNNYYFEYAAGGRPYRRLGALACSLVSTEVAGGFTGVVLGMYAQGRGYADFHKFTYKSK